jgi:hypothetical protein
LYQAGLQVRRQQPAEEIQVKSFLKFSIPVLAAMALSAVSFGAEEKVKICHFPPGNTANVQVITVGASAVPAHLDHGDLLYGEGSREQGGCLAVE